MTPPDGPALMPADVQVAAVAFGLLAAEFVTSPETWPVFAAWADSMDDPMPADFTIETGRLLAEHLAFGLTVAEQMNGDLT